MLKPSPTLCITAAAKSSCSSNNSAGASRYRLRKEPLQLSKNQAPVSKLQHQGGIDEDMQYNHNVNLLNHTNREVVSQSSSMEQLCHQRHQRIHHPFQLQVFSMQISSCNLTPFVRMGKIPCGPIQSKSSCSCNNVTVGLSGSRKKRKPTTSRTPQAPVELKEHHEAGFGVGMQNHQMYLLRQIVFDYDDKCIGRCV